MADKLPKFIVLQSLLTEGYVCYIDSEDLRGYIRCMAPNVFATFAKIQVEQSKTNPNYVHLRFCNSNKYWARSNNEDINVPAWILASSNKPVEDTTKPECTLFEPFFDNDLLYFSHVQSGGSVCDFVEHFVMGEKYRLGVYPGPNATGDKFAFKFVDWDTLVTLPKRVAFKGDNDRFLTAENDYCTFSSGDGNSSDSAFVVEYARDGHVLVMAERSRKYLRNTHNWIQYDGTEEEDRTLFWPVKIDESTIALKSKWNNQFCKRLTLDGNESALNAADSYIGKDARMKVEELVLERSIYNVRYRMEDKRIFEEKPFLAGVGSATNDSDKDATLAIKIAYETTSSYKFSSNLSIKAGVSTKIETGVPFIAEGSIEVSVEVEVGFEWENATAEKKLAEAQYTMVVPARTKATVNYVGTEGKCNVPFTYTKKDKRSSDGNFVTSVHDDGIFTGVNYYSFRFEELPLESI